MADSVRIGIIGTGGIAGMHAQCYREIPEAEIVGLCDIVPGRAEHFKEKNGYAQATCFTDHRTMLEKLRLDAVSVCTYNTQHAGPTIDALEAGLHVQCEKPMSVTLEQAVAMATAAKKADRILTIGFQPRYDPNTRMICEMVQSGKLGKVYYVETGGGRRRGIPGSTFISKEKAGIGALADIGCYSLDSVLEPLGYPKPLTVSAFTSDYFGKSPVYAKGWDPKDFGVDDFAVAFVRLEGDIILNFKISWDMHCDSLGSTLFFGTDGGLKCDGRSTYFHDLLGRPTSTPVPYRECNWDKAFTEKIRAFIKAVQVNGPAPIPASQIVLNQAIIDAAVRSAASKREVEVFIPEI